MNKPKQRPPAMFVADAPSLDFLNTQAKPTGKQIDWLENGGDLLAWLEQARMLPPGVAQAMRADAGEGELDEVAARARELRAWFRDFVERHRGRPLTAEALSELAPLNALLARDETHRLVALRAVGDGAPGASGASGIAAGGATDGAAPTSAFIRQTLRRWRAPATLLAPLADAMAELICSADFSLVKKCESPSCTLLFHDTTQGHARRWCSMAICGNRAKQAAYRARLKQGEQPAA